MNFKEFCTKNGSKYADLIFCVKPAWMITPRHLRRRFTTIGYNKVYIKIFYLYS